MNKPGGRNYRAHPRERWLKLKINGRAPEGRHRFLLTTSWSCKPMTAGKYRHTQMDTIKDIQPLTAFRKNSGAILQHLKKTKRPVTLTVNGKVVAVVQDPKA